MNPEESAGGVPGGAPVGSTQPEQPPTPGYVPSSGNLPPPGYAPPPGYVPPPGYRPPHTPRRNDVTGAFVIGLLLILAGGYFLARQFLPALDIGLLWPVVVIVIGAILIVLAFTRRSNVQ